MFTDKQYPKLVGKQVSCYWNLRKDCVSVRHRGKVVAHLTQICLEDVEFRVAAGGRERVRREQAKNVHAFVHGRVAEPFLRPLARPVTYDPYQDDTFVSDDAERFPQYTADRAEIRGKRVYI